MSILPSDLKCRLQLLFNVLVNDYPGLMKKDHVTGSVSPLPERHGLCFWKVVRFCRACCRSLPAPRHASCPSKHIHGRQKQALCFCMAVMPPLSVCGGCNCIPTTIALPSLSSPSLSYTHTQKCPLKYPLSSKSSHLLVTNYPFHYAHHLLLLLPK